MGEPTLFDFSNNGLTCQNVSDERLPSGWSKEFPQNSSVPKPDGDCPFSKCTREDHPHDCPFYYNREKNESTYDRPKVMLPQIPVMIPCDQIFGVCEWSSSDPIIWSS